MIFPSAAQLLTVTPHADRSIIFGLAAALPSVCSAAGIVSISELAHFLGQAGCETDGFKTYEEYASGAAYEGRHDLGNTVPGWGRLYKGRGAFDITGHANYVAATPFVRRILNRPTLNLALTPQIVATDKAVGLATSIWYWQSRKIGVIAAQGVNDATIKHITRIINGGENGLALRAHLTYAFYKMLVYLAAHHVAQTSALVPNGFKPGV
jgi:putative chitinase